MTDPIEQLKEISNELYEALEDSELQSTANELLGVVDDVEKEVEELEEEKGEWQDLAMSHNEYWI